MVNQKLCIGLIAVALASVMLISVAVPAANALTPRNFQYFYNNHKTDFYVGGPYVCGDHMCTADEWSHMVHSIRVAQRSTGECPELKEWKACGSGMPKSG